MGIFEPKPWVNPFAKMSMFGLFQLLVFIGPKSPSFVLEDLKKHSPGLPCLNKKVGKMSIFAVFDLLVLIAQKGVFSS